MSDLIKVLKKANLRGLHPPQSWTHRAINEIERQQQTIKELNNLLSLAKCPNCDGSGAIVVSGSGSEAGCCGNVLPNGECCGNAVEVQFETQELEQCLWCYEKNKALAAQHLKDK